MSRQVAPPENEAVEARIRPKGVESAARAPQETSLVVLRLGSVELALPILAVREVLPEPHLSRVPFTPSDVCGVFALRGQIVPVVDLGLRLFNRPARRPGALVVVMPEGLSEPVGLLVDSVPGLIDAGAEVRDAPVDAEASLPPGWVAAVVVPEAGRPIALLDLLRVLDGPNRRPAGPEVRPPPAVEDA